MTAATASSVPASAASSKPSSINSQDDAKKSPGPVSSNDAASRPTVEKASVKERFSRMFSNKDLSKIGATVPADAANRSKGPSTVTNGATSPKPQKEEKNGLVPPKAAGGKEMSQRFVSNPDLQGGHEHQLKSSRRQEKLSDMWRALIGKKPETVPDHDLSLVSNWVDSLQREKDEAFDKKGGPNCTTSLVEKYGKCHEVVGRGAFGIVRISHKKIAGSNGERLFAVKEFRRRPEESEKKYSKRLTAEFCISSSLRHPNVIHTLDLLKDAKGDYCEVMEFCAGGDLYSLVLSSGKLEVQEADCFFKQMMRGVEYLHEMGVAHRDLKPENLLLTTRGALKITDFGNGECFRMAWETDAHMVTGLCGSAPYISPEEYTDKEFDARAVDVWACGVIYMAMRTGRHLWRVAKKDDDEFYARYLEGRRDEEGYGPIEALHRVSSSFRSPIPYARRVEKA